MSQDSELIARLVEWLRQRAQPDSGIHYSRHNPYAVDERASVQLYGSDADFIAKHFHGQGARDLADTIDRLTSTGEAGVQSDRRFAVVSTDFARPFLLGFYSTLERATRAQGGSPDKWAIYSLYVSPREGHVEVPVASKTFDALERLGEQHPHIRGYYARATGGADLELVVQYLASLRRHPPGGLREAMAEVGNNLRQLANEARGRFSGDYAEGYTFALEEVARALIPTKPEAKEPTAPEPPTGEEELAWEAYVAKFDDSSYGKPTSTDFWPWLKHRRALQSKKPE